MPICIASFTRRSPSSSETAESAVTSDPAAPSVSVTESTTPLPQSVSDSSMAFATFSTVVSAATPRRVTMLASPSSPPAW